MALTKNEQPAAVSLAGNPIWIDYSTDNGAEDFIGIHYSVYAFLNSAFTLLGNEMRFEPNAAGNVQRDIHKLLEWDPQKQFSWPEKVDAIITKRNDLRRLYTIEIYEKHGNPLAEDDSDTIDGALFVLPGKVSDLQQGILNEDSVTWWGAQQIEKKFLTNSPRQKITDAWSSERLYFLVDTVLQYGRMNVRVKLNYTDNTSTTITRESILSGVGQYDIFEIITSFSTLGLYLHDTSKVIESYEVWLADGDNNAISETFTYVMDHIRKSDSRYFIFANTHKMPEGIRFAGKGKSTGSYQFQQSSRNLDKGHSVDQPSMVKSNTAETITKETSSGWLTLDEMNWYREFLLSTEVYEIVNGKTVPVLITTSQAEVNKDDSNLRSLTIQYKYAHADRVPGVIPEAEADGIDVFTDTEINFGNILNVTDSGFEFYDWTFDDSTQEFTSESDTSHENYAKSGSLSLQGIPIVVQFYNIGAAGSSSDLEAALAEGANYTELVSDGVFLTVAPDNGFAGIITAESNCILILRTESGNESNVIQGVLKLYKATRRYLEYLYENR